MTNTMSLAVADPGDPNQLEVIAGDARLMLELAYDELHGSDQPNLAQVESAIVAAAERVQQLEQFGEMATAALAGIRDAMQVVERQRDEAVRAHAELEANIEGEVEARVEAEMMYHEEYFMDTIDWAELRWEAEENFVGEVEYTVSRLVEIGQKALGEELAAKLAQAKALRDEVQTLMDRYQSTILIRVVAAVPSTPDPDDDFDDDDSED